MDIVRLCISKPVGVTVGVILTVMFGLIGLAAIPVQLTPTVDRPIVTVTTNWPGRSPQEVVDEITKEQEERLKNVSNLRTMQSMSSDGMVEISLEFNLGADITRALQEVSDSLRQVPSYPDEVDEPQIKAAEGAAENAIAWIITDVHPDHDATHGDFDITTLFDAFDKEIKPALERIDGVAEVNVFGGREREARVFVDSIALAQRGLNHADVVNALAQENQDVSAGTIAEGKRDYRVRLEGQFEEPYQILETIIAYRDGRPVYVKDVARVEVDYQKQRGFVRSLGRPCLAMNIIRQSNANVVDVMTDVKIVLDDIRVSVLPNFTTDGLSGEDIGPHLRMRQVYDETIYIESAIDLVTSNLWIGGLLAALVLLVFLRSFVSTGVIALAIPVSVVGTFLVLVSLDRTLNVISLAGLAFAVGMVVDNAIVVLENIYRRLGAGESPMEAAYNGGREVWGAVLASTLTTVAVFVPILTIQEEAGQLFRDISLAIVAAVTLSLIVSITVIPTACSRWLRPKPKNPGPVRRAVGGLFGLDRLFAGFVRQFVLAMQLAMTGWRGWTIRPALILVMTGASLYYADRLMPPLDYLPAGNRNLVFGGLLIPPGLSVDERVEIAEMIEEQVGPYTLARAGSAENVQDLGPIRRRGPSDPFAPVPVDNFFIGAFGAGMFVGATSAEEQVVIPVGQLLTNSMTSVPDSFGGASQSSLFGRGVGGGNTIDLQISGPDLDRVIDAAGFMFFQAAGEYGFGSVRPDPANFNLQQQEWTLRLNDLGRELGLTTRSAGVVVRGLFDGAFVGDYKHNGDTIDLVVLPEGGRLEYKEQISNIPIATPAGRIVSMDSVVDIVPKLAAQQIQRIEELSSVTIQIRPPEGEALEEVKDVLQTKVIDPAREMGMIDRTMRVRLDGTAAKLDEVQAALFGTGDAFEDDGRLTAVSWWLAIGTMVFAGLVAGIVLFRAATRRNLDFVYGAVGALLTGAILAGLTLAIGHQPELLVARFVWALLVTYLLMAALFESFIYPLVIMFTVPLAIVGGFAGLKIVHDWSMADPTKAPQQLDVLTMLGFVILIGVVVNNAILLVHQSLSFMSGRFGEKMEDATPAAAVAAAIGTRIRPIFMSVLTSVGGMAPLVLFPGAGSEMYRGLGSVVIGGLLVSTVFTLVLVPMTFSLTLDMVQGLRAALKRTSDDHDTDTTPADRGGSAQDTTEAKPELQPA